MIIAVCTNDAAVWACSVQASDDDRDTFGAAFLLFEGVAPMLGEDENLWLAAHCASWGNRINQPEIGKQDRGHPFGLTGMDLWANIRGVIPKNYAGDIFIDASESADRGPGPRDFSFIDFLQATLDRAGVEADVWGFAGDVDHKIHQPDFPGWVQAS